MNSLPIYYLYAMWYMCAQYFHITHTPRTLMEVFVVMKYIFFKNVTSYLHLIFMYVSTANTFVKYFKMNSFYM